MKRAGLLLAATVLIIAAGTVANAQILAWDTNGLAGNETSFNSTTTNTNLNISTLTRGAGLNAASLVNSFNSDGFTTTATTLSDAITNNDYLQFNVNAKSGFKVSLSTLDANFRRTSTGPNKFQWQYSLNGFATAGVNIGSEISFTDTNANGVAQTQINLSGIQALQNLGNSTTVTIRLYGYGATNSGGGFAVGRLSGNDLAIGGTTSAVTAVKLQSFRATSAGSNIFIEWRTGYEVDNVGFNLYREQNGKRVQLNPSVIVGSAFLGGPGTRMTAGDSYSWFDPKGTSDSVYYLEDIDLSGTRTLHDPAVPAISTSGSMRAEPRSQAVTLSELNSLGDEGGVSKWQRGWAVPVDGGAGGLLSKSDFNRPFRGVEGPSLDALQGGVKLFVRRTGWYHVTQAELAAAGFNTNIDPAHLQLFVGGFEVPMVVNTAKQGQFSTGDSIEFYGTGLDTPSTDTNVYWLVAGDGNALRVSTHPRPPVNAQPSSVAQPQPPRQNGLGRSGAQAPQPVIIKPTTQTQVNRQAIFNAPAINSSRLETLPNRNDNPEPKRVKDDSPGVDDSVKADDSAKTNRDDPANAATDDAAETKQDDAVKAVRGSTARPSVTSQTAKQSGKSGKRARKPRRKFVSRNHAMISLVNAESFAYTVELKERLVYVSSLLNGDTENFYGKVLGSSAATEHLFLSNLATGVSGNAPVQIAVQGYTLTSHQVQVKVNDQEIGSISFANQEHAVVQLSVPYSLLREGDNTVTLERSGDSSDFSLVDWVRLTYEHSYRADGNLLYFTGQANTRIDGFTSANIRVMDTSDPMRVSEVAAKVEATSNGFAANVALNGDGNFIAFTDDKMERPSAIELDKPSNLKSGDKSADMLIITYGDFLSSLDPLAKLRQSQGLQVSVVDVKDIYDEFGYGAHSPYAVKSFLSWAEQNWQKAPKFLLLVGDASIDPRNYLGGSVTDLVPTKLIDAATMETASDDWLVDFNSDGVPEMAVGRLPVRTVAEANQVVAKIAGYKASDAVQQVLVVVDKNNSNDGFSFVEFGQQLGALVPSTLSLNTINRANGTDDAIHSQILSAINQGPLAVNYIGHGSVEVWTGALILSTQDTGGLNNGNHLPVFVMMTCLNGYFPNPARESLAEALMRSSNGGAVAVWASSGMTEPNAQAQMNQELYRLLFGKDALTLGEAAAKAKESVTDSDVRRTWILFGDPTVRLQ